MSAYGTKQTYRDVCLFTMVGSLPGCCARAVSGHAAAPPSSVMNLRRFIFVVIR